jgi:nucleoside-diphosphate-sugar epimerase
MQLFVTGANGFIGDAVTRSARSRGHRVVALVRSSTSEGTCRLVDAGAEIVVGDVCERGDWVQQLSGCDAVVHLAANFGAAADQWDVAVRGTANLADAMIARQVERLVLVSSISVYDFRGRRRDEVLDETSPIEPMPNSRDGYVRSKLGQEQVVADRPALKTTIVRPGAVYGRDRLWNAGLALRIGHGPGLTIAPDAALKLTYVDNCAEAIVLAAERDEAIGTVLNIVDDALPTQRQFAAALRRHGLPAPRSVPIPYAMASAIARIASAVNTRLFGGRLQLPEILVPARLDARYKPLTYSNLTAKRVLGWTPRAGLDEALDRVAAAQ